MKEIKDALLRMVRAHRMIGEILDAYVKVGLDSHELFTSQGEITEAIYDLLGEHEKDFTDSITHIVMSAPYLTDERRTELLYFAYLGNHPEMPSPVINDMSPKDFKKSVKKNGGYCRSTPEGEWI